MTDAPREEITDDFAAIHGLINGIRSPLPVCGDLRCVFADGRYACACLAGLSPPLVHQVRERISELRSLARVLAARVPDPYAKPAGLPPQQLIALMTASLYGAGGYTKDGAVDEAIILYAAAREKVAPS